MKIRVPLKQEIKRLSYLFVLLYLATIALLAGLFVLGHHNDQVRLASSYSRASKDSLITLDLRQAIVILNPALQDGFTAIAIRDHRETLRAGLPKESALEDSGDPFDVRIRMNIQVGNSGTAAETIAILDFHYSILTQLLFAAIASLLMSGVVFFFFRRGIRNLERKHFDDLEAQKTELLAWVALQVSHDMKSPLGVLTTLAQTAGPGLPEPDRQKIIEASKRISDITGDLLSKARGLSQPLAAPVARSHMRELHISDSMNRITAEKIAEYKGRAGLEIEAYIPTDITVLSRLSEKELGRIISNMVNNSAEALPEGGLIKVVLRENKTNVSVQVSDDGKGMTSEILEKVATGGFSNGSGHGLGLSHARAAIEEAGGKLDIISTPGAGTIITIQLPK
ncbi:MAG: sensor histidine kinase [Bdellovibrio sp.]|jgi:signal transduction histidine kinase